jgi:uncharacterized protein (UPF0333 family)
MKNKAQISLEILIIVLLIIVFLHIYVYLSEQTASSLEINKIKEQQIDIALEINNFLKTQDNFFEFNNNNYVEINNKISIPSINIASKKVNCVIDINSTNIVVYSSAYNGITTNLETNLDDSYFDINTRTYCAETFECFDDGGIIVCKTFSNIP